MELKAVESFTLFFIKFERCKSVAMLLLGSNVSLTGVSITPSLLVGSLSNDDSNGNENVS